MTKLAAGFLLVLIVGCNAQNGRTLSPSPSPSQNPKEYAAKMLAASASFKSQADSWELKADNTASVASLIALHASFKVEAEKFDNVPSVMAATHRDILTAINLWGQVLDQFVEAHDKNKECLRGGSGGMDALNLLFQCQYELSLEVAELRPVYDQATNKLDSALSYLSTI